MLLNLHPNPPLIFKYHPYFCISNPTLWLIKNLFSSHFSQILDMYSHTWWGANLQEAIIYEVYKIHLGIGTFKSIANYIWQKYKIYV